VRDAVLAWLDAPDALRDEGTFDRAARALFAWQRAHNPDYAALSAGVEPAHWSELPAAPVALFRDLDLSCAPPGAPGPRFHTSGTTSGRPGVHRMLDTVAYDRGARLWAEAVLGALPPRALALVAPAATSSLWHMCAGFHPGLRSYAGPEGVAVAAAWEALQGIAADGGPPVFLPGTAFAWAEVAAHALPPVALPAGSVAMVTGGYKGRQRTVGEEALRARLAGLLPGVRLVGEYGMTELSSQLWADPLGAAFQPPPWMRVLAVDPWTGTPLPAGATGLLRFVDLLNHQSVLCVETEDLGEVGADGRVSLRGRNPGAQARGCSLSVEEALRR
jgi:hypothetical protein